MKTTGCTDHCICEDPFQKKGMSDAFWFNVPRRIRKGKGSAARRVKVHFLFQEQPADAFHAQTLSNASLLFPCSPGAMGNFLGSTQAYLFVSQGTFSHYAIPLFKFRKVSKNIISLWLWELLGKNALGLDFLGMKASVG